MKLGDCAIKIL